MRKHHNLISLISNIILLFVFKFNSLLHSAPAYYKKMRNIPILYVKHYF